MSSICGSDELVPRSWATKAQWAWLEAHQAAYLEAKKDGTVTTFLSSTTHDFFVQWSEHTLMFGDRAAGDLSPDEKEALGKAITERRKVSDIYAICSCRHTDTSGMD